jgi:hypothetical protein
MGKRKRMLINLIEVKTVTSRGRRPKLSFEELLAKYKKEAELNVINRPRKIQSSKLPPKHKSQE